MTCEKQALTCLGVTLANRSDGWIGAWAPGNGDPTVFGWVTVIGYLLAACACAGMALAVTSDVSRRHGDETPLDKWWRPLLAGLIGGPTAVQRFSVHSRLRSSWMLTAIAMLALSLNKQLDLQTAVAESGRWLFHARGWYEKRRLVQVVFIGFVSGLGLGALRLLFSLVRPREAAGAHLRKVTGEGSATLAFMGSVFLLCFVAVRASSLHQVDGLLRWSLGNVTINVVLELSGVVCVLTGALHGLLARAKERKVAL